MLTPALARIIAARTSLADHYEQKMLDAIRIYTEQQANYNAVKAAYADRHPGDPVTARRKADDDPRCADAAGMEVWFRDEAVMYGIAALVMRSFDASVFAGGDATAPANGAANSAAEANGAASTPADPGWVEVVHPRRSGRGDGAR